MISRRRLLVGGGALAGTGLGLLWLRQGGDSSLPPDTSATGGLRLDSGLGKGFDRFLASLAGTDPLGAAWVEAEGVEHIGSLVDALDGSIHTAQNARELADAVAGRVRADFQEGLTCRVGGWVLSGTECRLVGLRHLLLRLEPGNAQLVAAETKVPSVADYAEGHIAPLANWGPKSTRVGEKFNVQIDGHSGLWFQFSGAPAHARIVIDGELVKTSVSAKVVTSGLFGEMQERILATPGRYDIALVDPVRGIRQPVGQFVVRPRKAASGPGKAGFCEIEKWGPQSTRVGLAKNEQPDGAMGLWVRSACMPRDAQLIVGDDVVKSSVKKFGLSAAIPAVFLEAPGELELVLYSPATGQRQPVGVLVVE
ncbi:hypothetical protein [Parahaliea mediterranea]|uniref:Uncharacterized protein n=1 Tax=Parahaliea mediterranea TaxID=651086 RepID=A0A939IHA9_9GAMM|nr:hypothetical protein [Parahaliea mediterranea]MBN7795179.1 hypothetical protein [Parahaliea mediterranea]